MNKPIKTIIKLLGTSAISAGVRGVSKSSLLGMYEPEIPAKLNRALKLPQNKDS